MTENTHQGTHSVHTSGLEGVTKPTQDGSTVKLVGLVTLQAESMQAVGDLTDLMGWNRQRQRSGRDLERNALARRSTGVDEARLSVHLTT